MKATEKQSFVQETEKQSFVQETEKKNRGAAACKARDTSLCRIMCHVSLFSKDHVLPGLTEASTINLKFQNVTHMSYIVTGNARIRSIGYLDGGEILFVCRFPKFSPLE
ncbi:hypothetical protein BRADI_5g12055v3 [Brachypodium distachyon]|uniref:Uncharacterized protein n=1 Tax=Brachypodium distachyon TaxID=15368 RepID=A0A2K2CGQ6_BRADI|nr:hypothetical protein BRADI_5g12055v3 [Brachypodium distachyon]